MMYVSTPGAETKDIPGQLPPDDVTDEVDLDEVANLALGYLKDLKVECLTQTALWRDWLSLTGLPQTYCGNKAIFETWRKAVSHKEIQDLEIRSKRILRPCHGSSWVSVTLSFCTVQDNGLKGFHTANVGLIPESNDWRIWVVVTILESFEGQPHPDEPQMAPSIHPALMPESLDYAVTIVGGGQGGLALAGRLKALNIPCILIEKGHSVGNAWTSKYDSVRQHTLREYNNLPFGRTWHKDDPELLPGRIVAGGFASYVEKYNIEVLTSSNITSCTRDDSSKKWTLTIETQPGASDVPQTRTIKSRHLAIATGAGVGAPSMPTFKDQDRFTGTLIHQSSFQNAKQMPLGSRAVVVGTGTTAHDIAQDLLNNSVDVTMIQRGPTPIYPMPWVAETQKYLWNLDIETGLADRMGSTAPVKVGCEIIRRNMKKWAQAEQYQDLFRRLEGRGFRIDRQSGMLDLIFQRYGGYYIDVGTSKHIANGEIKVKSGVGVRRLTERGILFEDGEELQADLIVAATGYERDYRKQVGQVVGDDMACNLPQYWGLTIDGDVRGMMTEARPGLWMIGGTAPQARWTSRFVALAMLLDLLGVNNTVV